MRGLRFPLCGYALPAVSPRKEDERELRTERFVAGDPTSAKRDHAVHHVASLDRCQIAKIQLLVILKHTDDPVTQGISVDRRCCPPEREQQPMTYHFVAHLAGRSADVTVGLAIDESYVILGSELQDLKLYKVMNRWGSRCPVRRTANNERRL